MSEIIVEAIAANKADLANMRRKAQEGGVLLGFYQSQVIRAQERVQWWSLMLMRETLEPKEPKRPEVPMFAEDYAERMRPYYQQMVAYYIALEKYYRVFSDAKTVAQDITYAVTLRKSYERFVRES